MKKADEIVDDAIKEGQRQDLFSPNNYALGVLIASYDLLLMDYELLKEKFESLNETPIIEDYSRGVLDS